MSASSKKKLRATERSEGLDKKAIAAQEKAAKAKKTRRSSIVIAVIVVIIIACAILLNSSLPYTAVPAVQIGATSYPAAEFNYYYNIMTNQFVEENQSYIAYMIDFNQPLAAQDCLLSDEENYSWADFFFDSTVTELTFSTALYDDAVKNGHSLTDAEKSAITTSVENMIASAEAEGLAVNKYLSQKVSKGMTIDLYEEIVTKQALVNSYISSVSGSFSYTQDEMRAYYAENKDTLDMYTLNFFYVSTTEEAYADMEDEEAAAAVHEAALAIADATNTEEFQANVIAYVGEEEAAAYENLNSFQFVTQGNGLGDLYRDWMLDSSRQPGDTTVFDSDTGTYAIMFVERNDNNYPTVDMRHILIAAEADENGVYTEEALAAAEAKAEEVYALWQENPTEDNFAALATEYSTDPGSNSFGGLYQHVYRGAMVDGINDFCFESGSKPGDTTLVYGTDGSSYAGYHVVYYVGEGDNFADYLAEYELRSLDYEDYVNELSADYEVQSKFGAKYVNK